jgi:predicted nucleotidyltransferase component of viral defense system
MIKEFTTLTNIAFPFKSDRNLRRYLEQINTIGYNLKVLEKDFYLTGLLGWISTTLPDLSFKGGTCLNKIHFPYFRLSEDLDFSLPITDR